MEAYPWLKPALFKMEAERAHSAAIALGAAAGHLGSGSLLRPASAVEDRRLAFAVFKEP